MIDHLFKNKEILITFRAIAIISSPIVNSMARFFIMVSPLGLVHSHILMQKLLKMSFPLFHAELGSQNNIARCTISGVIVMKASRVAPST